MLEQLINELRAANGRHPVKLKHILENYYCQQHCHHMAFVGDCVHTPTELLNGKAEACAKGNYFRNPYDTLRMLVMEKIADSEQHRNIILFHENLAAAFCVDYYNVYVTVRGW